MTANDSADKLQALTYQLQGTPCHLGSLGALISTIPAAPVSFMRRLCRSPTRQGCTRQRRCLHGSLVITSAKMGWIPCRRRGHRKQRLTLVCDIGTQNNRTILDHRHLQLQKPTVNLFWSTQRVIHIMPSAHGTSSGETEMSRGSDTYTSARKTVALAAV